MQRFLDGEFIGVSHMENKYPVYERKNSEIRSQSRKIRGKMSIDGLGRVVVGSGHFIDRVPHLIENASRVIPNLARNGQEIAERTNTLYRLVSDEGIRERNLENLKELGEAAKDLAEAFGWGAAGDIGQAQEKAVDAFGKMASVFWRGLGGPRHSN